MCDLADVHEAVEVIRSEGNTDIVLLQCTSLYPTEPRHVHLRAMDTLRAAFQLPVGFSDHTMDVVIPAAAVARGACVIEKHLTLSRQLVGPDHGYALEPPEFRRMVEGIRATEAALGTPAKTMLPEEARFARRESIRAARDIQAGEVLTLELLVVEHPAQGLRPRYLSAVLGRRAAVAIAKGEGVTWEKLRPAGVRPPGCEP
jgi:sialic acid synthase SpsE